MTLPHHDLTGAGIWPEGVQCAVALTIDLDFVTPWLAKDPEIASKPGALSMARYGPQVGVPLILSLLEKAEVDATFFVPGMSAEDYPATVESVVAAGHEIAVHGYTHEPPSGLSREVEEDHLSRTLEILRGFGVDVAGYRAPVYDISVHTMGLLQEYGIRYSSNLMDDFRPYRHPDTDVIELPVHWIMDDWTQFVHGSDEWLAQNATCGKVRQLWMEEFEGIHALGGLFILILHPQVIGRPSRLRMLADLIEEMRAHEGVWMTNCGAIADHISGR